MVEFPLSILIQQIETCRLKCKENDQDENDQNISKNPKIDDTYVQNSSHSKLSEDEFLHKYKDIIKPVPKYELSELKMLFEDKRKSFASQNIETAETVTNKNTTCNIINAFCHPDVITEVKKNILQQI